MMQPTDQDIRKALAGYRAQRALNLMKAGAIVVCGVLLFYLASSGSIFAGDGGAPPPGTLLANLGKEKATWVAYGIAVLVILFGLLWLYNLIRDLTTGYKRLAEDLRRNWGKTPSDR